MSDSDELTDRLSKRFEGETKPEEPESEPDPETEPEPEQDPDSEPDIDETAADSDDEDAYDPQTEPAFPYEQRELQNSVYVRKETWQQYQSLRKLVDAHATANGYEKVAGRELDDAILRAAADLDAEEIAERIGESREARVDE